LSIGVTRYLADQGCIKPLCDLLDCPDARIIMVCLEGLENILNVGEEEKRRSNTENDSLYFQMIEDSEGFEKIENLQSHDNHEIYERAVKILETYFLNDEDEILPSGDGDQSSFNFGSQNLPSGGFNF